MFGKQRKSVVQGPRRSHVGLKVHENCGAEGAGERT